MGLKNLTDAQIESLAAAHRQELKRRKAERPAQHFPWHDIQKWILRAPGMTKKAARIILAAGGNRGGKALPLDEPVLTPGGWRPMGDIRAGDRVIAGDGSQTEVVAIPHRGVTDIVRVEFTDGSWVRCSPGHLWEIQDRQARFRGGGSRVMSTQEIVDSWGDEPRPVQRPAIPILDDVELDTSEVGVDPYVVGLMLGDGCVSGSSCSFTTADQEMADSISSLTSWTVTKNTEYGYLLSGGARQDLRRAGVVGTSHTKSVPRAYRINDRGVRLAVLQGLMDTDGTITRKGKVTFSSTSLDLAEGVAFLAQSLGCLAVVRPRITRYEQDGEAFESYRVSVTAYEHLNLFRLPRKLERQRRQRRNSRARIWRKAELVGRGETQCITVAHPSGTFVTRFGIVTHNSKVGMGLCSEIIRRESPVNDQLMTTDPATGRIRRKNDRDPITIWIVPPTLEKARQDWLSPQDQMGLKHWAGGLFLKHTEQPDNVVYTRPPGVPKEDMYDSDGKLMKDRCDKTIIKSQDQKLETFESSEVDFIIFDEEVQSEKIWNSCLLRIATTNGLIMMTYTPLHGLSWSYHRYWKHLVDNRMAKQYRDRCWIHDPERGATVICAQMGSKDNPRAREYADEIEADPEMTKAEKSARLYGEYGYVEGTLLPALSGLDVAQPLGTHQQYVVDTLPGQRHKGVRTPGRIVKWLLVTDPNKSYGGVLSAIDGDGNVFFVAEHLQEGWPDRKHAAAFQRMEKKYATGHVERYADPGSAGAQSIVNMADSGLYFNTMPKGKGSVSASIKKLRGLTYVDPSHTHPINGTKGAPRVYFYRPGLVATHRDENGRMTVGCKLAEQISEARQTDNESAPADTPHKDIRSKLDLFDCARYTAVLASDVMTSDDDDGRPVGSSDRLPTDMSLKKGMQSDPHGHPMDQEIWLPEYQF